jgi:CubicO group peptidase (beta-lactamase class C family)
LLQSTSGPQTEPTTEVIYASPDVVQLALAAELDGEPGAKWACDNEAVNLLAGVVRRAPGVPLDAYVRREIFGPLGIAETGRDRDRGREPARHVGPADRAARPRARRANAARRRQVEGAAGARRGAGATPRRRRRPTKRDVRGVTFLERKPNGFAAKGYLGQYVVVLPGARPVGVRTRRSGHGDDGDREASSDDVPEALRELVAPTPTAANLRPIAAPRRALDASA